MAKIKKVKAENRFTYDAEVLKIYDGDTFKLRADLGFGVFKIDKFRLYGLDTPESKGKNKCEKGVEVYKHVIELCLPDESANYGKALDTIDAINIIAKKMKKRKFKEGSIKFYPIRVKIHKQGKFGRYLCEVTIVQDKKEINLNEYLLKNNMAKEYYGGKR